MARKRNTTTKASRKNKVARAPQSYRQPLVPLGVVTPLSDIEIGKLVAILSPESAPDDRQLALISNNLYRAIDWFVWDVILNVQGYPETKRNFLEGVNSDPLLTLAKGERTPNTIAATRTLLAAAQRNHSSGPAGDELASAANLIIGAQKAARRLMLHFRGRDKREDYALRDFLSVVVYIAGEFNSKLDLPQHSDRGGSEKTSGLFEFAKAVLVLAADRGLTVAFDERMLSTERMLTDDEAEVAAERFRAYARKPTSSRSAFIKNLEGARPRAASVRKSD